jgi:transketolase
MKKRPTTSAMIASIVAEGQRSETAPFGHALANIAQARPEIVGLSADVSKYTDLHVFAERFPDRFFQMGMAEQLLMGAAAGLAHAGWLPFATTFAAFATRRAYDFIFIDIAESNLNVKIVCALPGLGSGYGPSHQAMDDIAIMRAMPNMVVLDPCDACEIGQAVRAVVDHEGPVYMRILRGQVPMVLDAYDYRFELGRAKMLRAGGDVLLVSTGLMTIRALEAANVLGGNGIEASVLHVSTLKPLDTKTILDAIAGAPLTVTMENHSIIGGLGQAVGCAVAAAGLSTRYRSIALPDEFLGAGALPTLHERYGLSGQRVAAQVEAWLQ